MIEQGKNSPQNASNARSFRMTGSVAKIAAILSGKGGSCKTTASVCLAAGLAGLGEHGRQRVALIDADIKHDATTWVHSADRRLPIDVYSLASAGLTLPMQLEPLAQKYDWLVIDCAPNLSDPCSVPALLCADICLTPLRPTPLDLTALSDTAAMVAAARKAANPGLLHRVLIGADKKTSVAADVINVLMRCGTPVMRARLGDRTSFPRAAALGSVPQYMGYAHRAAAEEVEMVVRELTALLEGEPK